MNHKMYSQIVNNYVMHMLNWQQNMPFINKISDAS